MNQKRIQTPTPHELELYRTPVIKQDVIQAAIDTQIRHLASIIIEIYLNPLFKQFHKNAPNEKEVQLHLNIVNNSFIDITTVPYVDGVYVHSPLSNSDLFTSALYYIPTLAPYYGFNVKESGNHWVYAKCLDKQSEQDRLVERITSYKDADFAKLMEKAHASKKSRL